jgi:predicted HicB family RNase H-like nuclease
MIPMVYENQPLNDSSDSSQKKIHINLPEEVHRKLRIKCALQDLSIQEFVSEIISKSVCGIQVVESDEGEPAA